MENPKPRMKATMKKKSDISEKVGWYLDELSKSLDADILAWIKEQIEKTAHVWLGEKLAQLKVNIVMDTNMVNSTIKRYAKGDSSIIFKLEKNPFFSFYAPKEIEFEVQKFIKGKKAKGLDRQKLREGWEKLKQNITIKDVENDAARKEAMKLMGNIDLSDIPFVGLYIEMSAHAVLTYDKDYEIPSVRTFSMKSLNDIVGVFHRGTFSFFIMNDVLPLVLEFLYKAVIAIARGIYGILKLIWGLLKAAVSGLIKKAGELISMIPPNAQKILGIGLAGLAILLILRKGVRDRLLGWISPILELVRDSAEKMAKWVIGMISTLIDLAKRAGPHAGTSLTVLAEIHTHLIALSEEIKNLDLKNAAYYS
ncbi:MAG: PIN domain-containing protein [Rhabdochlamydiaceae bacterium]